MAKGVVDTVAAVPGEVTAEQPIDQGVLAVAEINPLVTEGLRVCKRRAEILCTMHTGKNNMVFVLTDLLKKNASSMECECTAGYILTSSPVFGELVPRGTVGWNWILQAVLCRDCQWNMEACNELVGVHLESGLTVGWIASYRGCV